MLISGANADEPQDDGAQKLHLELIEAAFDGDLVRLDRLAQQVGNWEVRHYRAFHFGARDIDRDRPSTATRGISASVDLFRPSSTLSFLRVLELSTPRQERNDVPETQFYG